MVREAAENAMNGTPRNVNTIGYRGVVLTLLLLVAVCLTLYMMGRPPICTCGTVKLWYGPAYSDETSQHLLDWYSLSHVNHGFIFFGLLWLLLPGWRLGDRLAIAVAIEGAWEIFENTAFIIDRYREQTVSLDYYGDSVINSFGDLLAMMLGFLLASRLPWQATVALGIAFEIFAGFVIRDNLSLNILMLLWPLQAIKAWQMGA